MRDLFETRGRKWKTIAEIDDHFPLGVPSPTKLMGREILPYAKLRNLARFDVRSSIQSRKRRRKGTPLHSCLYPKQAGSNSNFYHHRFQP